MILATADGGIATTEDGRRWQRRSSTWASELGALGAGGQETSQVQTLVQDGKCVWASHWKRGGQSHQCSVWESCDGRGRDWRVLGGWAPPNGTANGLELASSMTNSLAIDFSSVPQAGGRRLLLGAAEGKMFHYSPDREHPQWRELVLPAPVASAKGSWLPLTAIACVSSSRTVPGVAFAARGYDILRIDLSGPAGGSALPTVTALRSAGPPSDPMVQPRSILPLSPSLLVVGAASSGPHSTAIGSRDRLALLRGVIQHDNISWTKTFSPLDELHPEAPEAASLMHMFFSDIVQLPRSGDGNSTRLFAGLQTSGDYFDGADPPSPVYASDSLGVTWAVYEPALAITNHKAISLLAVGGDGDGEICVATDGTGLQCVNGAAPL